MLTKPYTEIVVIYGLSPIFMGCSLLRDVAGQPAFPLDQILCTRREGVTKKQATRYIPAKFLLALLCVEHGVSHVTTISQERRAYTLDIAHD